MRTRQPGTSAPKSTYESSESLANRGYLAEDLNLDNLAGSIEWEHALDFSKVTVYDVRLQDASGGSELVISTQPVEQTNVTVASTLRGVYQRVAIYSQSKLCVATTPAVLTLEGATLDFTVSTLSMTDLDLDQGEIGGDLKWEVPRTIGPVVKYSLYLAQSAA